MGLYERLGELGPPKCPTVEDRAGDQNEHDGEYQVRGSLDGQTVVAGWDPYMGKVVSRRKHLLSQNEVGNNTVIGPFSEMMWDLLDKM